MCGINMLLSHPPEGKNSQEFKDSQQFIFNPSEFLKYLTSCKLSSLHIVGIVHIVHWEDAYMVPIITYTNIVSIWGFF